MAAVDDSSADLPVAYLIFQDPQYSGSANVTSATSQGSASFGLVEASTSNRGQTYAYQEGTPTGSTEITLRAQGGAPGVAGGYVHRLSTESSTTEWKAQNAITIPFKNRPVQTADRMYAHGVVYSRVYDRVIVAYLTSATNINVYYMTADAHLSSPTSTTITITDGDVNTPNGALDMEELPDGTLILMVQVKRRLYDMDLYTSSSGGTTWTLAQRGVGLRDPSGLGYGIYNGQSVMRRSGDFLRVTGISGNVSVDVNTFASADRGGSWKYVGGTTIDYWPGTSPNYFVGSAPFDIIGLDDIAGTFLMATTNQVGSEVKFYVAQGLDDWTVVGSLAFDYSDYATSPKCKGVWFARGMDRIWLYAWIEGSDASEIVCRMARADNPLDAENWTTVGTISAFGGVLRYGPHRPRAVFAGNRIYFSAGIQDATTAGGGDALVAGHWTMMLGGMDTYPMAPSTYAAGWYLSAFAASFKLIGYNWQGPLGGPTLSGITPYTRVSAGTSSVTWNVNRMTITASGLLGSDYYQLAISPGSSTEAWGHADNRGTTFHVRLKVSAERITSADDCGFRIIAPTTHTTTTTGYDVSIRTQLAAIVIYDNVAGAAIGTLTTTDATSDLEVRVTISGTSLWIKRRLVSAGPTAVWTLSGPYTMTSGTIAGQRFRVGVLAAAGVLGTSTIDVYEWLIGKTSDTLSQRGDLTKPDDMFGTPMTTEPVLVTGGAYVGWAGPGSIAGDTYTAALEYARGVVNLSATSPRYYWESTSLIENAIVFDARTGSGSGGRWQVDGVMLIGTTDLGATLQFNATDSWGTPSVSVSLSAALWTNLSVNSVDGNNVVLTIASGTFEAWPGQLIGLYLRFTSGSAQGKTYQIISDQDVAGLRVLGLELSGTLGSAGVVPNDTVTIFGDRMVYLSDTIWRYRYMRVVFPDVSSVAGSLGTATGTHRLGAFLPGKWVKLARQDGLLDVQFTDSEEGAYSRSRSRSGVDQRTQEGPSARSIALSLVNGGHPDDVNGARGELVRQVRDMVRTFGGGGTKPVGLVIDSLSIPFRHVTLYGTLGLDGVKLDHEHTAIKSNDGKWHFVSSADFSFEEDT